MKTPLTKSITAQSNSKKGASRPTDMRLSIIFSKLVVTVVISLGEAAKVVNTGPVIKPHLLLAPNKHATYLSDVTPIATSDNDTTLIFSGPIMEAMDSKENVPTEPLVTQKGTMGYPEWEPTLDFDLADASTTTVQATLSDADDEQMATQNAMLDILNQKLRSRKLGQPGYVYVRDEPPIRVGEHATFSDDQIGAGSSSSDPDEHLAIQNEMLQILNEKSRSRNLGQPDPKMAMQQEMLQIVNEKLRSRRLGKPGYVYVAGEPPIPVGQEAASKHPLDYNSLAQKYGTFDEIAPKEKRTEKKVTQEEMLRIVNERLGSRRLGKPGYVYSAGEPLIPVGQEEASKYPLDYDALAEKYGTFDEIIPKERATATQNTLSEDEKMATQQEMLRIVNEKLRSRRLGKPGYVYASGEPPIPIGANKEAASKYPLNYDSLAKKYGTFDEILPEDQNVATRNKVSDDEKMAVQQEMLRIVNEKSRHRILGQPGCIYTAGDGPEYCPGQTSEGADKYPLDYDALAKKYGTFDEILSDDQKTATQNELPEDQKTQNELSDDEKMATQTEMLRIVNEKLRSRKLGKPGYVYAAGEAPKPVGQGAEKHPQDYNDMARKYGTF